ncbi:MAG: hypothetical protein Q9201_003039 [Fulgogasparrea decipioides]
MTGFPAAPPVLSTSATHIFEDDVAPAVSIPDSQRSPDQIHIRYEIDRTVAEIKRGRWKRIALQFPDSMLPDAPTVFESLTRHLHQAKSTDSKSKQRVNDHLPHADEKPVNTRHESYPEKLSILADTSYGACCVDEIAAEHVDADVVVHYGRACLSPTARLPVIHVFTIQPLATNLVMKSFESTYPDRDQSIILMSDITYASHLPQISEMLREQGYSSIFTTEIVHDPSSPLPNRTVPESVRLDASNLKAWRLFHISDPPDSLLLTLASRVSSIHVFPTTIAPTTHALAAPAVSSTIALRRRYALLTSVSTASIFGILINTLSVKHYLHMVEHVKSCISAAGKKSYTFVVGKINAAKVANFSEIGAWVVIGCWESSLIDSKDFWKPILTPFELELALKSDDERVWTGEWKSDFQTVLQEAKGVPSGGASVKLDTHAKGPSTDSFDGDLDPEPESVPPQFDLRTGRYVANSRPMQEQSQASDPKGQHRGQERSDLALVQRPKREVATIGNQVSPGAEFLRSNRIWKGLGSNFDIEYDLSEGSDSTAIEEGRSGLARGYLTAHSATRT